jgi:hypothetical protein
VLRHTLIATVLAALAGLSTPSQAQLWSGTTTLGDLDYTGLCHHRMVSDPTKQFLGRFGYERLTGDPRYGAATGTNSSTRFDGTLYVVSGGQALGGTYRAPTFTPAGEIAVDWASPANGSETPYARADRGTLHLPWDAPQALTRTTVEGSGGYKAPNPLVAYFSDGWWYNPAEAGTGLCVTIQGDTAFVLLMAGDGSWYMTTGAMTSATFYTGSLNRCSKPAGDAVCTAIGTISLTFRAVRAPTTNLLISEHIDMVLPSGATTTLNRF